MKKVNYIWFFLAAIAIWGCKKAYAPKAITAANSYLVVEGVINSGAGDTTYIKISRTTPLSGPDTPKIEHNAMVTVEGNDNSSYTLPESGSGIYVAPLGGLAPAVKYRLHIKTSDNKEYASDYVEVKTTPPIDSVTYSVVNDGVQFYANTHDPSNKTRYYRWDFVETYGYLSLNPSFYKVGPDSLPEYRVKPVDKIYECFKTLTSQLVLVGSSAKLTNDVIYRQPVDFIAVESGKISHGYSLLLQQYALTADAFNYWQNLKTNTEDLGTIFDTQPSEIKGNIHCVSNPSEPVVGFISASSVSRQRIFLDAQRTDLLVPVYLPPPELNECVGGEIMVSPTETFQERLYDLTASGENVLVKAVTDPATHQISAYTYLNKECTDCRAKTPYGTNIVPVFWPSDEHEN